MQLPLSITSDDGTLEVQIIDELQSFLYKDDNEEVAVYEGKLNGEYIVVKVFHLSYVSNTLVDGVRLC